MMKASLWILFLMLPTIANAQQFSNGSVFNYAVGDTIVSDYYDFYNGYGSSPRVHRIFETVTAKTICATNDTIYYTFFRAELWQPANGSNTPTVITSIVIQTVTNLSSSLINYSLGNTSCYISKDSTYSYCGMPVHRKWLNGFTNVCEPPELEHLFIEGIGTFTTSRVNNSYPYPGIGFQTKLVAFSKGTQTCERVGMMPTSIAKDSPQLFQVRIFPHPFDEVFTIETPTDAQLSVYNLSGQVLLQQNLLSGTNLIAADAFPPGLYFVKIQNGTAVVHQILVKETN